MAHPRFLLVDDCPAPWEIAPYIYLVLRKAGQTASSIYRGEDAKNLLHSHGKHTQGEIHISLPNISNPAGRSSHELRSDGVGYPGAVGSKLAPWEQGVDSGSNSPADQKRINDAASFYGWHTLHPYTRGVEGHHWSFAQQPRPKGLKQRLLIARTRAKLKRR